MTTENQFSPEYDPEERGVGKMAHEWIGKRIQIPVHYDLWMRGARIPATDWDGNRVVIRYDHTLNTEQAHAKAAKALCDKMGWHGTWAFGHLEKGLVFVRADDNRDQITT